MNEIKNKKLSPFERFLCAYDFVTTKIYKEESKFEPVETSRNLIEILNGDKIVCVGYANMLCNILSRLGIPCTTQTEVCYDTVEKDFVNHMVCLIRLEDPKYKIRGIYQSDPTADAAKVKQSLYGNNSFNFALNQLDYVEVIHDEQFIFDKGLDDDSEIQSFHDAEFHSKDVPIRMSLLFPEKTHGKNQMQIIAEDVSKKLKDAKIQEKVESFIDELSEEKLALLSENYDGKSALPEPSQDVTAFIVKCISDHIVSKEFLKTEFIDERFAVIVSDMVKAGVSLDEIKTSLKEFSKSFNFADSYLQNNEQLARYSKINERELYMGYDPNEEYDFFYNEPYEDEFFDLCDNATFVPQLSFYKALQRIFMADGFDFSDAGDFASQMLKKTNIVNPKHLI